MVSERNWVEEPQVSDRAVGRAPAGTARDEAIDWLRGLVMALMVLDHARDFWMGFRVRPLDVASTTPVLFATRWVTHFCAPVFVLLAGAAAYLYGARYGAAERTRFLLSRGLFLVLLEVTVVRLLWIPDPFYHFTLLQVIWAIGWSMVVLAFVSRAPRALVLTFGALLVVGHNALDGVHATSFGALAPLWNVLHQRGTVKLAPGHVVLVSYPLVPWLGVMALGYAFGPVVKLPAEARRAFCLRLGAALSLAFVLLRALNVYGDPVAWSEQRSAWRTALSFLNTEKYPPSLEYLAMTLGPALIVFAFAPSLARRLPFLTVFGKVPLLFYVLHLFVLRYTSLPVALARFGGNALIPPPKGSGASPEFPLYVTYVAWAVTLAALYPVCRYYATLKATKKRAWMSYL
jgi:uncharacterized membrane protein